MSYTPASTVKVFSHYKVGSKTYTSLTGATIESEKTGFEIKEIWVEK